MRREARLAGSVVIPIMLVAACAQGLTTPTSSPAPTAPPAASPSAVLLAAPCPDEHRGACRGPLAPGTFISILFDPRFAYTVPEGWENPDDDVDTFALWPSWSARSGRPIGEASAIYVFRDPHAAAQDAACSERPEPGIGTSATELAAWVEGLPGLMSTNRAPVSVGGLDGVTIDIEIDQDSAPECPWGKPAVPLFAFERGHFWAIIGDTTMRLAFLDLPTGGTVLVDIEGVDRQEFDRLVGESGSIIRSLVFATP